MIVCPYYKHDAATKKNEVDLYACRTWEGVKLKKQVTEQCV